jgi:predicted ATPase
MNDRVHRVAQAQVDATPGSGASGPAVRAINPKPASGASSTRLMRASWPWWSTAVTRAARVVRAGEAIEPEGLSLDPHERVGIGQGVRRRELERTEDDVRSRAVQARGQQVRAAEEARGCPHRAARRRRPSACPPQDVVRGTTRSDSPRTRTIAEVPEPFLRSLELLRERIDDPSVYPFSIPAIASLTTLELDPHVTLLCGANASGKSTLVEAIAVACGLNPEGGGRNLQFETRASHSRLGDIIRLVRGARQPRTDFFLRAESYFNVASELEALDVLEHYGGMSLHEQSHGQSFIALLTHRFGPNGLYILDEPEAALSPQGQLAMLARMHELVAEGCQLVIATHSPILLSFPGASIYELSESGIAPIAYDDTETVTLYRSFLARPDAYHRHLRDP